MLEKLLIQIVDLLYISQQKRGIVHLLSIFYCKDLVYLLETNLLRLPFMMQLIMVRSIFVSSLLRKELLLIQVIRRLIKFKQNLLIINMHFIFSGQNSIPLCMQWFKFKDHNSIYWSMS